MKNLTQKLLENEKFALSFFNYFGKATPVMEDAPAYLFESFFSNYTDSIRVWKLLDENVLKELCLELLESVKKDKDNPHLVEFVKNKIKVFFDICVEV